MPKYLNSNTVDTFLGINRIGAGDIFETKEFFSSLPAGVTKLQDAPMFNPILDSAVITSTTTKTVPANVSSYGVRVYVQAGSCTVTLNGGANLPVLNLLAGEAWEMVMHNRLVDTVTITGTGNFNYTVFTAGTVRFTA